jgi:hypothetical protein
VSLLPPSRLDVARFPETVVLSLPVAAVVVRSMLRLVAVSPGSSVRQKICVVAVWPFPAKVLTSLDAKVLEVDWAVVDELWREVVS